MDAALDFIINATKHYAYLKKCRYCRYYKCINVDIISV